MVGFRIKAFALLCGLALTAGGCSVIHRQIRSRALPRMPFDQLLKDARRLKGSTVILGGYILETVNEPRVSILKVLQTPLGSGDEPRAKETSSGRFWVTYDGFLDPEIYAKDRMVTVAGTIEGAVPLQIGQAGLEALKLQALQIHLWPRQEPLRYPPAYYDPFCYDPWRSPLMFRRYPFYPYRYYPCY